MLGGRANYKILFLNGFLFVTGRFVEKMIYRNPLLIYSLIKAAYSKPFNPVEFLFYQPNVLQLGIIQNPVEVPNTNQFT
jgi:hypothetical protein